MMKNKRNLELEVVEKELSLLVEFTIGLEDEVNHLLVLDEEYQ